jgi:hypothetical protein
MALFPGGAAGNLVAWVVNRRRRCRRVCVVYGPSRMAEAVKIVVLEGDQTGQELPHREDQPLDLPCRRGLLVPDSREDRARACTAAPKWTVSPVYEGMLKEELDAAAARHPDIAYEPVLIDAGYAGLLSGATDAPLVIPALNRDGDCRSDLVLPMFGSIAVASVAA